MKKMFFYISLMLVISGALLAACTGGASASVIGTGNLSPMDHQQTLRLPRRMLTHPSFLAQTEK